MDTEVVDGSTDDGDVLAVEEEAIRILLMTANFQSNPVAFINLTRATLDMNSSINIYMFHGGTTFGFMNGTIKKAQTPTWRFHPSSYDFDAPLSEAGDYTEKYYATADLVKRYLAVQTRLPELPAQSVKEAYPAILVTEQLAFNRLMDLVVCPIN
uniref:Glycoside hydrolase 35 catalytic domain-containing protein n=1 Tax=Timema monikensis TaxID=170555 RepID=A0A7R9HS14_9NEOP|nr:unnamed protein product [Timema monikensis]